uniref:Bax inhibitor 1 n=1 Tax=Arcella intermedia TaxID=1963864 RepID=A0A6B2LIJ8_9EUKA
MTLAATVLSAALGSLAHMRWNLGGLMSHLCVIGLMVWLWVERDQVKRFGILNGLGFCQGLSIGPLIQYVLSTPGGEIVLGKAFFGTTILFACFSGAALFSPRRSYLYLYATLASGLSLLLYLQLAALLFPTAFGTSVLLYLGLLLFIGYVVYDTQMILEKVSLGDNDFVGHALELFVDFVAIFVRLLIILQKLNKKKEKE